MVETPLSQGAAGTLRERATRGAAWMVAGQGGRALLRLGSNLILTRLLFPEAFGLVALAGAAIGAIGDVAALLSAVWSPSAVGCDGNVD